MNGGTIEFRRQRWNGLMVHVYVHDEGKENATCALEA